MTNRSRHRAWYDALVEETGRAVAQVPRTCGILEETRRGKPMPIYEYRCLKEGHTFEELQKIGDPPPEQCRFCDGPVTRVMSTTVRLRNAGIYIFDRQTGRDILHDD